MAFRVLPSLFVLVLLTASGCIITSRPPAAEYVLSNNLPEKIQIEAFDRKDKRLKQKIIEPNHETSLGYARRLVVHESGETLEYTLPSNLTLLASPQSTNSNPYVLTLGGQWRL